MRDRFDGFTAEKRKRFIATLGVTGCFTDAARVAGVSRETARRWRAKDAGFARECESAVHMASAHIETLAWERAVTGIEEPVWHYGKLVGTRIKRSDSIFRLLLMASNRKKYGRMGAMRRKQLEKWERERIERTVRAEMAERETKWTFDDAIALLQKRLIAFQEVEQSGGGLTDEQWDQQAPAAE